MRIGNMWSHQRVMTPEGMMTRATRTTVGTHIHATLATAATTAGAAVAAGARLATGATPTPSILYFLHLTT